MKDSIVFILIGGFAIASLHAAVPPPPDPPPPPPPPPTAEVAFLNGTTGTITYTGATMIQEEVPTNSITFTNMMLTAEAEWELTFEWAPEAGSSNLTTYPIRIQVPFEHDGGVVYVRARKKLLPK